MHDLESDKSVGIPLTLVLFRTSMLANEDYMLS